MTPAVTPQVAPPADVMPAGGTQAAVTAPPVAQPEPVPEHHGFLSDLLHAVGDVFAPKNVQRVNPQTGAIESVPASTRQRIAGGIAGAVRGAAAGAAEHGPGAVGRAALAGVQSADQARQIQQQALSRQSENVRQTNAAALEKQQIQANLAKMSQDQARGALDLKIAGKQLDEHQTALANSMQEILNIPGAKLLQHFDSNDEINSHLETVGPQLSKQYAIDLAKNNIRLVQNPKGGFDAVEVPKTAGEQPIGEGKKLLTPLIDPKTNKLTLKEDSADPSMTWDKFQQWNGNSFSAYNAAQENTAKITEQNAVAKKDVAQAADAYAGQKLKLAQAKNLEGGMAKTEDGQWNPASIPVSLVEHNMDPSQLSKRSADYNAKLQQASQYSLEKYGKPFDIAQAQEDYKFASTPATQNTLKYLNSLTGPDNKSGNLGALIAVSNSVSRTEFPALNSVAAWTKLETGDPAIAQFHAAAVEVADQFAKIMQGGGSGSGTSDAKIKQGIELLDKNFSKKQLSGVADTLRTLLANRKVELIGDNPYLKKQYVAPPAPAKATTAPSQVGFDPTKFPKAQ